MAEPKQCYLTFVIDLMDFFHWWTISPCNAHCPVLPMIACYIFNGKDKLLPGRGSLPAKFIGNGLLLMVEVLPPVELFCVVGEELLCRTGRGRERGASAGCDVSLIADGQTALGKCTLKERYLKICQSNVNNF